MGGPCGSSATEKNSNAEPPRPVWRNLHRPSLVLSLLLLTGSTHICLAAPQRPLTLVDVNLTTGNSLIIGPDRAIASKPGSTLKPFLLLTALRLGAVTSGTRVACTGTLRIAGRNLACSHPASLGVLDAREALAYSCNTYFARVAQQLPTSALQNALQRYGIRSEPIAGAPDQRVLLALGLEHVALTPVQLAHAYAALARTLSNGGPQGDAVRAGLLDSVAYGMAHAAQTAGLTLGGKTGTAHDPAPMLQHGWFAGIVFSSGSPARATHVVVVYAPGGNGNDAANAAHQYLQSRHP